ncbi:ribosomal RNA methyltransferase NOP2 [Methanocella conradii HZ254]|uniref:Ribosomal RNA methyltransferase NOP2 n=1 Tax=Methanocella conradii (strain DSM 24694 / JCM 17849 / CGMCC 1.5162 / HZ254) TaxID=1041930 RepID=H8I785_METCZ|nr:RsmB/NOP family class I SAM-dependent RNA methyltransferase [Methanocella conradii]AFD00336.1 ribosomal RNA methyltransferase NOP2 [Methanocella conradii HZ254]MDI6895855.1 RsmB/NOP family class I SAM-dependent RNA methyltransferase [Methanocella conradii]
MACDIQQFDADERVKALARKYGYPEYMVARFARFVPDLERFLASMEEPPRTYIRVNTLRINPNALIKRLSDKGFTLRETDVPDCLEVTGEPYSIGASAEFLSGYFYVQDKSSMVPPLALAPQPGDVVIDMAASPGGKTTHLAQMMGNRGLLIAIEVDESRLAGLRSNLGRCGIMNTVLFHMDARDVARLEIKADKILLDAPCTGEGVIAKDRSRKTSRGIEDIKYCSGLQEELIDAAHACLKPGGILVYSTCSFAPEENECNVDYAIKKYGMKVEPIPYGEPGLTSFGGLAFEPQVKNARRLYPHIHGTSGFFVARLKNV